MKKITITKKAVALLMIMILCISMMPMDSFATESAQSAEILYSGTDGDLDWSIDSNGHLLVEGKGDYSGPAWLGYKSQIKTATINISYITTLEYFFDGCSNLISVDLSGMDTSMVTDMRGMFYGCSSLKKLDVSHFDTSQVTDMTYMFTSCSSILSLDLGGFDTSKVTRMDYMFFGCSNLISLNVGQFSTTAVRSVSYMFTGCTNLVSLDLSSFNWGNLVSNGYDSVFYACENLRYLHTPKSCARDITLPYNSRWTNENGAGPYKTFPTSSYYSSVSQFLTADMSEDSIAYFGSDGHLLWSIDRKGHFTIEGNGNALSDIYVPEWWKYRRFVKTATVKATNITKLKWLFYGCSSLTSVDLTDLNTSKVTDMTQMFDGCGSLKSIELGNFDTSEVTAMDKMFQDCRFLSVLDLSAFDMTKVTTARDMLTGCAGLRLIQTPKNTQVSIVLPNGTWVNKKASSYTSLPIGNSASDSIYYKTANISGLEIVTLPTKTNYIIGDTIDLTGITVQECYKNGLRIDVPSSSLQVQDENLSTAGLHTITVKYNNLEATFDIQVFCEQIEGYSISLNGDIAVNFYMNLSDEVAADTTAYMQFTMPNGEVSKVMVSDAKIDSTSGNYIFPCGVSAAEMTDEIKAQIITTVGETQEYTYSVKTYADYILTHTDVAEYAKAAPLVKAMLNYGGYSQKQFNYNTDNLANADLYTTNTDPVLNDAVSIADTYAFTTPLNDIGLKYYGSSLLLNSKTTIRHYFTITGGESLTEIAEKYTFKLEDGTLLKPKMKSGMICVDIEDINAPDLDEVFNLTVTNTATNGTIAFGYSPMTYAKYVLDYSLSGQNLVNVIKAMYWYNQAANEYFV